MQAKLQLSRRALLSGAAASLAMPFVPRGARALSSLTVSEAAWRELDRNITGGVQRPGDPRFGPLTKPENLRYYNPPADPGGPTDHDAPLGVVRPHSAEEVAFAIRWARENNLPMVPRSGGHSYAGCSTVPGLIIHSGAMQDVCVKHGLIEAGGGALFGNLLDTLRDIKADGGTGCYTITHGRCRGVGLSAYLMGGGLSLDSPYAGMGCDRVAKVEIVLADGQCVIASDTEHPDLFWAVRGGGGGNLGFATKWWLNPLAVQEVVAFYGTWRLGDNARSVFGSMLRAFEKAPDRMGAQIIVSTSSGTVTTDWPYEIRLACLLHGSREEFDAILGPTLAEADRAESQECKFDDCSSKVCLELPYWDAQEFFEIQAIPNRYQETSVFAAEVTDPFIDEMFSIWKTWPRKVSAARWSIYRLGGKVGLYAPEATAYVHRPYPWVISTDIDWAGCRSDDKECINNLQANLDWQRTVQNRFSEKLGGLGSFYNFPDPGLAKPAEAYWGSNLPRLRDVKLLYDPDSVFTPPRNQGINS